MRDGGTSSVFSECDPLTDDRPLRQGDVFEWLGDTADCWRQLGIVITADCDIAREKHRGLISYVPVLPLEGYLSRFYLPKQLERGVKPQGKRSPIAGDLLDAMRKHQAALPGFPQPISEEAALDWATRSPPSEIADELGISNVDSRAAFERLVDDYRLLVEAYQCIDFDLQMHALATLRARQSGEAKAAYSRVWNDISSSLESLPGDCFFIGRLTDLLSGGFVAYLRLVREVDQQEIAIKVTPRGAKEPGARRIARLRSPYVYRLTQQLADVFASIGLPSDYETARSVVAQQLGDSSRGRLEAGGK